MNIAKTSAGIIATVVLGLGITVYVTQGTNDSKEKTSKTSIENTFVDTTAASSSSSIDTAVNSRDISGKDTYVIDSSKITNLANSDKAIAKVPVVKKPTLYGGVEVNDLEKFANAKLVGVDSRNIAFYFNNTVMTYGAKGLLFELNNHKLMNIIAESNTYYLGQRYDIEYHTFKKGVVIDGNRMLNMFVTSDNKPNSIYETRYDKEYDGVLVNYELNRKK